MIMPFFLKFRACFCWLNKSQKTGWRFVVLSILCFLISSCKQSDTGNTNAAPQAAKVAHPLLRKITEWDEYTGRFQPVEEVEIRARVSGYLSEVKFQDGQKVNKGDVLFVIDQRPFDIALQSATGQYELALKEMKRAKALRKSRAISQEDLDRRVQEYNVAKAALDSAQLDMEFTEVKSPINGRVGRDLINVGNLITGGTQASSLLTTVVTIDPIHFYFDAGERELLKYIRLDQSGQREGSRTAKNPTYVKLQDQQTYTYRGFMDFVDNQIDDSTGTIIGRAIFANKDEIIQPGMFGRARLLGRKDFPAILVPDEIIGTDQSRKFVYVLNQKNEVEMRTVQLGRLHNNSLRIVESGLTQTDKVVVKGLQKIRAQMQVSPVITEIAYPEDTLALDSSVPPSIQQRQANILSDSEQQLQIEKVALYNGQGKITAAILLALTLDDSIMDIEITPPPIELSSL